MLGINIATIYKVCTPSSLLFSSTMAYSTVLHYTICVLVLCVTSSHCSPIKCSSETVIDVNFQNNLTEAITLALPNIEGAQNKAVALLENIASLLQSQLSLMSEQLSPPAAQGGNDIPQNGQVTPGVTSPQVTTPQSSPPPRDCQDIAATGVTDSGVYEITPRDGVASFTVWCDMDTDGGGWTVFQKRFNGVVDFYEGWLDYERGFGSTDGEYWLGLQRINQLTSSGTWVLRVDLESFDYVKKYAKYESFQVGDAETYYILSIGTYSGNAGDELRFHNNQPFSTRDTDHDGEGGGTCAQAWKGGYWYNLGGFNCHDSNLNGLYFYGSTSRSYKAMTWGTDIPQKKSEMKMRRVLQ